MHWIQAMCRDCGVICRVDQFLYSVGTNWIEHVMLGRSIPCYQLTACQQLAIISKTAWECAKHPGLRISDWGMLSDTTWGKKVYIHLMVVCILMYLVPVPTLKNTNADDVPRIRIEACLEMCRNWKIRKSTLAYLGFWLACLRDDRQLSPNTA